LKPNPQYNKFIATAPVDDFNRLIQEGVLVSRPQGTVLCKSGELPDAVSFRLNGVISLSVFIQDERAIQIAMIGREGVFAAMIGLGIYNPVVGATVQIEATMLRIPAAAFQKLVCESKTLSEMCVRTNDVLLAQASITAACNTLHPIDSRFCRLLLEMSDRTEIGSVRANRALSQKCSESAVRRSPLLP
jgi:CRP-like cAMP-binding protein